MALWNYPNHVSLPIRWWCHFPGLIWPLYWDSLDALLLYIYMYIWMILSHIRFLGPMALTIILPLPPWWSLSLQWRCYPILHAQSWTHIHKSNAKWTQHIRQSSFKLNFKLNFKLKLKLSPFQHFHFVSLPGFDLYWVSFTMSGFRLSVYSES